MSPADAPLPNANNLAFVEDLYEQWLRNPRAVDDSWRHYFERTENGDAPARLGPGFQPFSLFNPPANGHHGNGSPAAPAQEPPHRLHWNLELQSGASQAPPGTAAPAPSMAMELLQDRVDQLIRSYRVRGHMAARLDPLGLPRAPQAELEPAFYGLGERDMDLQFSCNTLHGAATVPLRDIVTRLRNTYCRSIGVQFMHLDELQLKRWLQQRMESTENRLDMARDKQIRILTRLTDAVIFEEFVQRKFTGAKSFSLEGGESLIPLLDLAIHRAAHHGIREIVLGMGHRGRLNVLANIMGKHPRDIFWEFGDNDPMLLPGGAGGAPPTKGDVKYHLGYSSDWITAHGAKVHLSLCFNPSHLEAVDAVAIGRVRAKQDRNGDDNRERGLALIIHGDAAFAGQGVVQETLNMSRLPGYTTGGTIHVVVNNQVGFTTSPDEGRSSTYATDVGRMLGIPIFHVNGEDPEAVAQVVQLALDFRTEFKSDVVIDMYCYRRRGHNEGDEPAFTQPVMYRAIEKRKPVREGYLEHLLKLGGLTQQEADRIAVERRQHLERELSAARRSDFVPEPQTLAGIWRPYVGGPQPADTTETAVESSVLKKLLASLTQLPADFHPHAKIERHLQNWRDMAAGERPLDWAAAEALAFGSLATQGYRIRLSGQDSRRGTFSHRHAVLYDREDGHTYCPLQHVAVDQAPVDIWNSPLSEAGVLGFDYGYSLDCPDGLTLWEAQFGDFCNGAQVIIDQFIVSAEEKWQRLSGLVLLLPHGFEGMGPEHSSARLERFLSLAAAHNIQVANVTTPAQYFHLLRRQMLRRWRKPLVIMTPKSLLRHPEATSPLGDFSDQRFEPILADTIEVAPVKKILLCSGKIYYDLHHERAVRKRDDVAVVRVEQLYPLAQQQLLGLLEAYPAEAPVCWVQEEPENMGAWRVMRVHFGERAAGRPFSVVSRPTSASPATGSAHRHREEQQALMEAAFA